MEKRDIDPKFLFTLTDDLKMSIRFLNTDKKLLYMNPAAERLTGYSASDATGKSCGDFIEKHTDMEGNELCDDNCPLDKTLKNKRVYDDHHFFRGKDGDVFPVGVRVVPVKDEKGNLTGIVEIMTDDRPRLEMEGIKKDIQRMIPVDLLTGLYTRDKVMEYFEIHLENSNRYKSPLGIIVVVLKEMEKIKSEFGKKKLEEVLQRVGYLIRMNTRRGDVAGRLGPEKFLIILPNTMEDETTITADKLLYLINDDSTLVMPRDVKVDVATAQFEDRDNPKTLLKRAGSKG